MGIITAKYESKEGKFLGTFGDTELSILRNDASASLNVDVDGDDLMMTLKLPRAKFSTIGLLFNPIEFISRDRNDFEKKFGLDEGILSDTIKFLTPLALKTLSKSLLSKGSFSCKISRREDLTATVMFRAIKNITIILLGLFEFNFDGEVESVSDYRKEYLIDSNKYRVYNQTRLYNSLSDKDLLCMFLLIMFLISA